MDKNDVLPILFGGFILLLLILLYETLIEPWLNKKRRHCILLTSKAQLIRSVIHFTGPILEQNNITHYPTLKIYYHKHKKWAGCFSSEHLMICVYLKNNNSIVEIVNTVLHEMAHYVQYQTDPDWFSNYDDYTATYGYYNNPLEIDSRSFAEKWTDDCLDYLRENDIIDYT